jgi:hypothetical protein
MTQMDVKLKDRVIVISWEHPWRFGKFRGFDEIYHKVTNCAIAQELDKIAKKYRFLGQGCAQWPLIAPDEEGGEGRSQTTARKVKLSKDRGRRIALKIALISTKLTKTEREVIWQTYFTTFKKCKIKVMLPPTSIPTSPTMPVTVHPTVLPIGVAWSAGMSRFVH